MTARNSIWPAIFMLSLGSMVFGGFAASQYRIQSARGPLLSAPGVLAVAADGRIYCASGPDQIYGYSPDGKLVAAWTLPEPHSEPRIAVVAGGRVEIARQGQPEVLVYGAEGDLLTSRLAPEAFGTFGDSSAGPGGERYEVLEGSIVRTDVEPSLTIVAALPWPLVWFARAPILIVPFLALGPPGVMVAVALAARGRRSPVA